MSVDVSNCCQSALAEVRKEGNEEERRVRKHKEKH
jgi:hypothetical protein